MRKFTFMSCAALLLAGMACVPGAAAADLQPQHVEGLRPVLKSSSKGESATLGFTAFNRSFHLRLASNPRLAALAAGSSLQLYEGTLEGAPGSWARISVQDGLPRGLIWDGSQLFVLDAGAEAVNEGAAGTVLFKLADAVLERGVSLSGDAVEAARDPAATYDAIVGELRTGARALQASVATEGVEISILGDAAYVARYDSEAQARDAILTRLNNVDGIFSAQVGVALQVVSVNLAGDLTAGLSTTTDASALLEELGRLRQRTPSLSGTGLTHLFTGRQLDGDTAGVAYTLALCSPRNSASLTMAHSSAALDSLIIAHEIGHVFGAPHDGTQQCASTPQDQYIMSPTINRSVTSFSQCSLEQIDAVIDSYACVAPLPPASPAPAPAVPRPADDGGGGSASGGGGGGGSLDRLLLLFLLGLGGGPLGARQLRLRRRGGGSSRRSSLAAD